MSERTGIVRLDLRDVYGERLGEKVDINLRNMTREHNPVVRGTPSSGLVRVEDLHDGPSGTYRIAIDPPSYLPVGHFVLARSDPKTVRMTFPVDPVKVTSVEFDGFDRLPDRLKEILDGTPGLPDTPPESGEDLLETLDTIRRAGLMNVATKAGATMLSSGHTVLSYAERLAEVRGDRIFLRVDGDLGHALANSAAEGLVERVSGALHELPGSIPNFDDFTEVGSYKTEDRYGNLQVTLFRHDTDFVADVDIDDAAGLGHVFQVLRNHLTGRPTHPYDIHEILMHHQGLYPGYRLHVT